MSLGQPDRVDENKPLIRFRTGGTEPESEIGLRLFYLLAAMPQQRSDMSKKLPFPKRSHSEAMRNLKR